MLRVGSTVTVVLLAACGGHLANGVYSKAATQYRVGTLSDNWQRLHLRENDLAFVSKDSPHALAVNATCRGHEDASLKVLTRHLLMGFTHPTTLSQDTESMDGREALRTHVLASLDGVPVELVLVVLKKDNCVYDFTYLSPIGRLPEHARDFETLLRDFTTEARS